MEAAAAFGRPRPVVKTEKPPVRDVSHDDDRDSPSKQQQQQQHLLVKRAGNNHAKQEHDTEDKTSCSSDKKDLSCIKLQEDQLESARAEMGEVREENQRLKQSLNQIMKDYEALKMQFLGIVGRDSKKLQDDDNDVNKEQQQQQQHDDDQIELVSLSLGRFPVSEKIKKVADEKSSMNIIIGGGDQDEEAACKEALSLGLNCKFEREESMVAVVKEVDSPNSFDHEATKEEAGETNWPSKGGKTMRSVEDDVTPQNPPKRARVCVRARCETATMNDGCQWRKYGQKIAKGNPCPRAYYRCTGSPTCPVRKQVQRCADDMSILITTYEGNHNHPLPASANAMASTTSAAASMLLSGSTTSATTAASSSTASNTLHGLNFYANNSKPNFYLPNNSSSIISSTSPTHPTITLDLTSNPSSSSSNSSTHFGKFTSNFPNSRYPFTGQLDFGSSRNNVLSWNNGLLSYNRNNHPTTTTTANNIYQNYIQQQQRNPTTSLQHQQPPLPDTIAAATKAITADPSFQSALAAALTSIIGTGGASASAGLTKSSSGRGEQSLFQLMTTTATTNKGNGCGTSFLNNITTTTTTTTSNSPPTGNMVFVPTNSKSASASPGDHIDLTH
ncbi:putative WRKY transcription factor 61 [Cucumis melo var. makuwa]|uniref:WRKY domain-containing protein n=2 Tax=Cucumis melo TaxID=3656 RepID=A0A9I9CDY9_CUCME|nr:putative WRKY transcription factor 61 [Cucumis melo var. makuwa]